MLFVDQLKNWGEVNGLSLDILVMQNFDLLSRNILYYENFITRINFILILLSVYKDITLYSSKKIHCNLIILILKTNV